MDNQIETDKKMCERFLALPIEEALIEIYLAGVSVRRVEDITEALWGTRVSPCTTPMR